LAAYLLDTNVLIWLPSHIERVPPGVLDLLADPATTRVVSAVSAMEIATKYRLGKLPDGYPFVADWSGTISELMATETPLTPAQGLAAGLLDWDHKDPFDRMLAAQALDLKIPLVSADVKMKECPGLTVLW